MITKNLKTEMLKCWENQEIIKIFEVIIPVLSVKKFKFYKDIYGNFCLPIPDTLKVLSFQHVYPMQDRLAYSAICKFDPSVLEGIIHVVGEL